jgi:hypothetical protein
VLSTEHWAHMGVKPAVLAVAPSHDKNGRMAALAAKLAMAGALVVLLNGAGSISLSRCGLLKRRHATPTQRAHPSLLVGCPPWFAVSQWSGGDAGASAGELDWARSCGGCKHERGGICEASAAGTG